MKLSKRTGQKRRTESERAELLERFRQSGLTRVAFAQQNDVAISTLDYWLTRHRSGWKPAHASEHPGRERSATGKASSRVFREMELSLLIRVVAQAMG